MTRSSHLCQKRLHSLPLRASPSQKRWSHPPSFPAHYAAPMTITPADSDSEDFQRPRSHFSDWSSSPALSQSQLSSQPHMDIDRDMDMMEHSSQSSQHLCPGPSQPDHIAPSITGRMPTPIHATFAAQVRGNNWGATNQALHAANSAMHTGSIGNNGLANGMNMNCGFAQPRTFPKPEDPSVPRSLDNGPEWSMVQNRRLPSPISESGGEETPASPGMVLDSCSPALSQLSLQRPSLPHMPHSMNPILVNAVHPNIELSHSTEADAGMMDMEEAHSPASAPATPSPRTKFGHSRSKHTLNSWTQQGGMVKSFSIGYRADCEKCRLKIPGHFNHIIIS